MYRLHHAIYMRSQDDASRLPVVCTQLLAGLLKDIGSDTRLSVSLKLQALQSKDQSDTDQLLKAFGVSPLTTRIHRTLGLCRPSYLLLSLIGVSVHLYGR